MHIELKNRGFSSALIIFTIVTLCLILLAYLLFTNDTNSASNLELEFNATDQSHVLREYKSDLIQFAYPVELYVLENAKGLTLVTSKDFPSHICREEFNPVIDISYKEVNASDAIQDLVTERFNYLTADNQTLMSESVLNKGKVENATFSIEDDAIEYIGFAYFAKIENGLFYDIKLTGGCDTGARPNKNELEVYYTVRSNFEVL